MTGSKSKRREQILGFFTSVMVLTWAWTQLVLHPISEYRDKLDASLVAQNLRLREARKTLTGMPQSAQESLQHFSSEGSAQQDMARMIKDIEAAASGAGLRVLETKPQSQVKNVGWFEMKVSLVFEGSWNDVVQFLYQLESLPTPLLVNEMSLEANLPQQVTIRGRLEIGRILISPASDL